MKRYEEYKESGVKWIGKVPSHWKDCKIKFIASCNDDVLSEKTNTTEIIDYVEIGDVVYGQGITNSTQYEFADAPSRARRITKKGDIIVSTVRTYLKAIAPIDAIEPIVSTGFAVIRPRKIDSLFAAYTFTSDFFVEKVVSLSVGVSYPAINASQIVNIKIPCPPLSEQRSIASFLDAKTKPIDAIISKREKQIELLEEMRSAIISRAVTKGLNPNAKMKDSGMEWIEKVPSHWDAIRLKFCGTIKSGDFLSKDNIYDIGSVEVYGGNGFIGCTSRSNITPPAIIIGRVGALCGNVRLVTSEKWVSDNALVLHIQHKLIYQYTSLILQAVNLNRLNTSSAQPLITGSKIMNVFVPVPPLSEQHAIASYLDTETSKIDARIAKRRRQIELLQEYKQALITDAVTGKIDVRKINS